MPGENGPPKTAAVKVPMQIVQQIAGQAQQAAMAAMANAVVSGDYEGAEVIPDNHKLIIGDMLLTLAQNRRLETVPCEFCGEIRMEHPLDLATGHRYCKDEHQAKFETGTKPAVTRELPERHKFTPKVQRIVQPEGEKTPGGIVIPGR